MRTVNFPRVALAAIILCVAGNTTGSAAARGKTNKTDTTAAAAPSASSALPEECKIGVMVKAIQAAIDTPREKASLETIARYGTDSRYYMMIRGWLVQELAGVQSQLDAADVAHEDALKEKFRQKAEFLQKAVRRIDLE